MPHAHLTHLRRLGKGAFGDVDLAEYAERGLTVAVKCNGTNSADVAAIDNEWRLYDKLLLHPHDNILPVYGICTDALDGKVRLVMKYCEKGSLDNFLTGTAKHEVCSMCSMCCVQRSAVCDGALSLLLAQRFKLVCVNMLCRAA